MHEHAIASLAARRPLGSGIGPAIPSAWPQRGAVAVTSGDGGDHAAFVAAVAAGQDREAFAALFRFFAPRVKAWLLRRGLAPATAEEIMQETMLAVWRKAGQFDIARASVSAWIFTIARNHSIDMARRAHHPDDLPPEHEQQPDLAPRADALLDAAEREDRLRTALAGLSPEQAEVIHLSFYEDKPHAEIERRLGIPLGTVKSRLRLAMVRLRAALEDLNP